MQLHLNPSAKQGTQGSKQKCPTTADVPTIREVEILDVHPQVQHKLSINVYKKQGEKVNMHLFCFAAEKSPSSNVTKSKQ